MKWISVDDRLPELGVDVLTFSVGYLIAQYTDFGEWYDSVDIMKIHRVSHWMPLPDPPELKKQSS